MMMRACILFGQLIACRSILLVVVIVIVNILQHNIIIVVVLTQTSYN